MLSRIKSYLPLNANIKPKSVFRKETNWTAKQKPISPFLRKLLTPTTPTNLVTSKRGFVLYSRSKS